MPIYIAPRADQAGLALEGSTSSARARPNPLKHLGGNHAPLDRQTRPAARRSAELVTMLRRTKPLGTAPAGAGAETFAAPKARLIVQRRSEGSLNSRHPVITLDGLGGVGKTAIAIQALRELYDEKAYLFIVSLSAKSKIWIGYTNPRKATFAGLHGLLSEISAVFPDIPKTGETAELKRSIISFMKDVNGLILVDNLEEVDDPGVLKFLSLEIPDPVKVIITSRIRKDMGSLIISIPEMTFDEAEYLLRFELERLGCTIEKDDEESLQAILRASGGVPLAIKWAAQIASERRSLRSASAILRGSGTGKQELLSFCFAAMYEALGDTAKDAARLIPYLDTEWKPMTLSIALDLPIETIKVAIHEISDKGIIFPARDDRRDDGYAVLPLTKDFLSNKWNESEMLRRRVADRFAEMFSSDKIEGFLLDWPEHRRVEVLREHAQDKAKNGEYGAALKLARLAQTWLPDARLRFLEGQILYGMQSWAAGLTHMRYAIDQEQHDPILQGEDILFFADALFSHGGRAAERDASEAVLSGVKKGAMITEKLLTRFIECNIRRHEYKIISDTVSKVDGSHLLSAAFDQMGRLLDDSSFIFTYAKDLLSSLERLNNSSSSLDEERRYYYRDKYKEIREKVDASKRWLEKI